MSLPPGMLYAFTDFETTGLDQLDKPIQVGMIITDSNFKKIGNFSAYLRPYNWVIYMYLDENKNWQWHDKNIPAYNVHKISTDKILNGMDYSEWAFMLQSFLDRVEGGFNRLILVSDNGQFEYNMMQKIYKDLDHCSQAIQDSCPFPFHYSPWCTNFITNLTGNDRDKTKQTHDAWGDVEDLYNRFMKSLKDLKIIQ